MRSTLLTLALISVTGFPVAVLADQPVGFDYQWSFSGKQYATVSQPIKYLSDKISLDGIAGYELKTGAQPTIGFGASYKLVDDLFKLEFGTFVLFPQKQQPDFGVGFTVSW